MLKQLLHRLMRLLNPTTLELTNERRRMLIDYQRSHYIDD